ncbi:MAG: hypothetical protein HYZ45_02105 [Burkholderiales bacterium]|nr:hypothetical protein [Burkholderiales bacterium]
MTKTLITPPSVLQSEEIQCAAIAMVVPRSEIAQVMGPALTEIFTAIGRQGKTVTGAWFTHHRCRPQENFEMEVYIFDD